MTNKLYPKGKEKILSGGISLTGDTIKLALVDLADYTYSDAHEFISNVPSAARESAVTLTGKAVTNGVFSASNPTFAAVTGDPAEAIVIYKDTGTESTSPLLCYIDNAGAMSVTPNGNDIPVLIDTNGIFSI